MRNFLGILLTIILVFPLILSTLVIYSISTWAVDRDLYIDALSSQEIQAQLVSDEIIQKALTESMSEIEGLDSAAFGTLIRSILPAQYFKDQVTTMVNQVFDFLEGKIEVLTLQFDLTEIKAAFNGPNQQELFIKLAQALPVCQEDQPVKGEGIYICKPDFIGEDVFVEYYLKPNLPVLLALIPDSITVVEPFTLQNKFQDVPAPFQQFLYLGNLKNAIILLAGLTLIIWFLTALIAGKNWKERLQWLGWTLIIPSIIVLVMGFTAGSELSWNMLQFGLDQFNIQKMGDLPVFTQEILQTLNTVFAEHISSSFILTGGFCSAIGLGFIAWGAVTHPEKTQKEEE
jgi:hypothetical protein